MNAHDEAKRRAAERALEFINDGQVVGLGTGTTAKFAIEGLGRLVREGLSVRGVPTSVTTERMARELGIPLIDFNNVSEIHITLDGADQVDPDFNMIKGGGGALTREKLVALASKRRVMLIDQTKLVSKLGQSRSLPVEVLPFGWAFSARMVSELGCVAALRERDGVPFVTDNANYILDCDFDSIEDPPSLEGRIKLLPGVIECGLFIGIA